MSRTEACTSTGTSARGPIALYYPYIHIRDDMWLKYAALYWWKMARLKAVGHPAGNSPPP